MWRSSCQEARPYTSRYSKRCSSSHHHSRCRQGPRSELASKCSRSRSSGRASNQVIVLVPLQPSAFDFSALFDSHPLSISLTAGAGFCSSRHLQLLAYSFKRSLRFEIRRIQPDLNLYVSQLLFQAFLTGVDSDQAICFGSIPR